MFANALLVLLVMTFAAPAQSQTPKVVRLGAEGTYYPFNSIDENGRFQGFEVDIAQALCAQMEVRCEFVQEKWDDMIPALLANRFDAVMASMSITEERKRQVAFSIPYYRTPAAFVTRKASNLRDTSPKAMKGRLLAGQVGTIHASILKTVYEPAGARIRLYSSQQEAQFDLARGRLDAMLVDKLGVFRWLESEQGHCCTYAGQELVDPKLIGQGVGLALRKEDVELRDSFDRAIAAIVANGTYKTINDRYFPFSIY